MRYDTRETAGRTAQGLTCRRSTQPNQGKGRPAQRLTVAAVDLLACDEGRPNTFMGRGRPTELPAVPLCETSGLLWFHCNVLIALVEGLLMRRRYHITITYFWWWNTNSITSILLIFTSPKMGEGRLNCKCLRCKLMMLPLTFNEDSC